MKVFAGIEIGGTKLQVVLGDENANILRRFRFAVDQSAGADGIRKHIEAALRKSEAGTLDGIGVGFGGPVDHTTGKIWTSYHIEGWSGFSLKSWLEELCTVPVCVDNDANVAALGEALFGAGRDFNNVFYVTLGSGVGWGLVIDKKIYHGALPGELEMGHIRLDKTGRTVQSSCSGWAVDEKIREAIQHDRQSSLAALAAGLKSNQATVLLQAINLGDDVASTIFNETVDDLSFGLSHAVHLLHPETVVLGGGLSLIGEPLRSLVEQKLSTYLMDAFLPGPKIQLSALKEDAVTTGALALAISPNSIQK